MDQIVKTGKVSRGYMGVTLGQLTPDLAQKFGVSDTHGALVNDVSAGGPGAKAGLQPGDVVTAIDGNKVEDYNELTLAVISHSPGNTVTLDVVRNGKPMKVSVTLGQRPNALDWNQKGKLYIDKCDKYQIDTTGNVTVRGITVENLTPELAQQVEAPANTKGVVIDDIDQASASAGAGGLTRGTIVTAVERHPVANVGDFKRLMNENSSKAVLLTVVNAGQTQFTVVPAK